METARSADHGAVGVESAERETIGVTVNGERRPLPAASTVASLLALHDLNPRLVVVEHNRVILRDRDAYAAIPLREGDVVELVHFVGGG